MALSSRVEHFARMTATAVRLDTLYKWGQGDSEMRVSMARFLHKEVAIRNAQLCKEVSLWSFGLGYTAGVMDVISSLSSHVDKLAESPCPETIEDDVRFTATLHSILEDTVEVVDTLGRGVGELRNAIGEDNYEDIRSEIDKSLNRFFVKRIGIRFLIRQYIESARVQPGISGIIHNDVAVCSLVHQVGLEARQLCQANYGVAPEVIMVGNGTRCEISSLDDFFHASRLSRPDGRNPGRQFTYVPRHLTFSLRVLLQNACFATAHSHGGDSGNGQLPPVVVSFAYGKEEVTIKVSDEGGGIPRSDVHLAMSFFSAPGSSMTELGRGRRIFLPLGESPKGVGLPLARLIARYYGGELSLRPIEGFGTDAYLFLNRLGENCEYLPPGVRVSPSMRDSSLGEIANIGFDSFGDLTADERSFLIRRHEEKRSSQATTRFGSTWAP